MNSAASQPIYAKLIGSRQSPRLSPLYSSLMRQGSFPPPALPGFNGTTSPSVICLDRPSPSRAGRCCRHARRLHPDRLPLLRTTPLAYVPSPIPRRNDRMQFSLASPLVSAFPDDGTSRLPHCDISGPARRSLSLQPARCASLLTEGFSWSASGHLSPPGPPQVLPAGARGAGWVSHPRESCAFVKAHPSPIVKPSPSNSVARLRSVGVHRGTQAAHRKIQGYR